MRLHNICLNDIFLANYFLKENMLDLTKAQMNIHSVFHNGNFLSVWLLCCYDSNKEPYISKLDLSNTNCPLPFLMRALGILCNLGADIDASDAQGNTHIIRVCTYSNHLIALRALIIGTGERAAFTVPL